MKKTDETFMRRALELAVKGQGRTSPNPVVGAVIVKSGKIVGEGYHKRAGDAHAEIVALRKAGSKARGADLYITLEPCCHYGRTPPCCDAIIKSGIKRVIVGLRDPNPLVSGRGIGILKNHKISVSEGVLKMECEKNNRSYLKWIVSGVPYVTLKVALSLDGKIATKSGDSKWITNESCRRYVHELRDKADAILVGAKTAIRDNPKLTVRFPGLAPKGKLAVVLDEKLRLPFKSELFGRKRSGLIVATTLRAPKSRIREFEKRGHKVLMCRSTSEGYVFLPHLLEQLGSSGVTSVLVEGGGEVYSDFLKRGLVDRIVACIAPKVIGREGKEWLPGIAINNLKSVFQLHDVNVKVFGDNVVVEGSCLQVSSRVSEPFAR